MKTKILTHVISFIIGLIANLIIGTFFSRSSSKQLNNLKSEITNIYKVPIIETFEDLLSELTYPKIKKMTDKALECEDKDLYLKANFLSSLLKVKEGKYLTGYTELRQFSSYYFTDNLDYFLAVYSSSREVGCITLLYSLVLEKLSRKNHIKKSECDVNMIPEFVS